MIRRRLNLLKDIVSEYNLKLRVVYVRSEKNDADILKRIPFHLSFLNRLTEDENVLTASLESDIERFKQIHDETHMGLQRSIFLAKEFNVNISDEKIRQIILQCNRCQSIDPAPFRWEKGSLDVAETWKRIAIDVTKFEESRYLTIIDCDRRDLQFGDSSETKEHRKSSRI